MSISIGVFLGLAGEQWRENTRHRELAELALRQFRSEIVANRKVVADVKDYHVTTKNALDAFLKADAKMRKSDVRSGRRADGQRWRAGDCAGRLCGRVFRVVRGSPRP